MPANQFQPGKGQQPRPGNAAQASRKRGREQKMQPSVRKPNPEQQATLEFVAKISTQTFGKNTFDLLIARRAQGAAFFSNVEPLIVYRSSRGFEVGYDGAAVRDFALNILHVLLADPTDPTVPVNGVHVTRVAWHAHEVFAREVLARIDLSPGEYRTYPETFLRTWIERNRWRWDMTVSYSGKDLAARESEA